MEVDTDTANPAVTPSLYGSYGGGGLVVGSRTNDTTVNPLD